MPTDLKKQDAAGRSRMNINEPEEVKHWCEEFGCTETQLLSAAKAVSPIPDNVRAYIANKWSAAAA